MKQNAAQLSVNSRMEIVDSRTLRNMCKRSAPFGEVHGIPNEEVTTLCDGVLECKHHVRETGRL